MVIERDQDRPPYDGRVQREVLAAFNEAHTIGEVVAALGPQWDRNRVHTWVKLLRKAGKLQVRQWITTAANRKAAVYQRVVTE